MKRAAIATVLLALAASLAFAAARDDNAAKIAELRADVQKAREEDRAKLLSELVRHEVELATQQFGGGSTQAATGTLAQIERDVEQCEAAADKSGKDLKRTDINLREAGRRLEELHRAVDFESQPAVKRVSDKIDQARSTILNRMFAPKKK